MSNIVGISQRISVRIIEQAMEAALAGTFTPELAAELAATEFNGPNRIKKAQAFIGHFTARNPLFDFIKEHKEDYKTAMHYASDRTVILVALINAVYEFGYDITTILGKFFHVQEELSTKLITSKMSVKYGNNRSLPNGMNAILPMYIEAGLIRRPKIGTYVKNEIVLTTPFAKELYEKSFAIHNPMLDERYFSELEHPYFEFIQ